MQLTFREKIFSLKRVGANHLQICLLGIRIKLRSPDLSFLPYCRFPIESKKIFFTNVLSGYGCNPRYVLEEMLRRKEGWDIVWMVDKYVLDYLHDIPSGVRLVMWGTEEALKECVTAHIWISNGWQLRFRRLGIHKRKGQTYIQLWHGSLGLKKLDWEKAHPGRLNQHHLRQELREIDYLITNSSWEDERFKEAFGPLPTILRFGHPRNDIFFKQVGEKLRCKVYERLNISIEKKTILYAPTYREDGSQSVPTMEQIAQLRHALTKRFGGEWLMLARWHPAHQEWKRYDFLPDAPEVINVGNYPNMQELLIAADAVLTDYSSCILDYLFTKRPGFLYAPDFRRYSKMRGCYYPLDEAPFPLAITWEKLLDSVLCYDPAAHSERIDLFLKKMGCVDDGKASARIVDLVEDLVKRKEEPHESTHF